MGLPAVGARLRGEEPLWYLRSVAAFVLGKVSASSGAPDAWMCPLNNVKRYACTREPDALRRAPRYPGALAATGKARALPHGEGAA